VTRNVRRSYWEVFAPLARWLCIAGYAASVVLTWLSNAQVWEKMAILVAPIVLVILPIVIVFVIILARVRWERRWEIRRERRWEKEFRVGKKRVDPPIARFSVRGLVDLAALLAGRKRPALRDEWRAHLAGESGHDPVTWQKVKEALGFVVSAIRCRCSDATDAAWTPFDAILKSRKLSNLFVLAPTWAAAYLVLRHEGALGVVKAAESIGAIGGILYGLVRTGRWWRNVKPPEPKAQRAKE